MAKIVVRQQVQWEREHKLSFSVRGKTQREAGLGLPQLELSDFEVVDQVALDEDLRPTQGPDRATVLIALVHPPQVPADHFCVVATAYRLHASGRGRTRTLAVVEAIANVQRAWMVQFGARFHVVGDVKPFLVQPHPDGKAPPTVLRAYGKSSRLGRDQEAARLYLAFAVIARAWDDYVADPFLATCRMLGAEVLATAAQESAAAKEAVLAAAKHRRVEKALLDTEVKQVELALDHGVHLDPRLLRELKKSPYFPRSSTAPRKPNAANIVYRIVRENRDALVCFAGTPQRGDVRPLLNKLTARLVGKDLGFLGDQTPRPRPPGRLDTRLLGLVARRLALRYHLPHKTVLKTIVCPALLPLSEGAERYKGFTGLLTLGSEPVVRKTGPKARSTPDVSN